MCMMLLKLLSFVWEDCIKMWLMLHVAWKLQTCILYIEIGDGFFSFSQYHGAPYTNWLETVYPLPKNTEEHGSLQWEMCPCWGKICYFSTNIRQMQTILLLSCYHRLGTYIGSLPICWKICLKDLSSSWGNLDHHLFPVFVSYAINTTNDNKKKEESHCIVFAQVVECTV